MNFWVIIQVKIYVIKKKYSLVNIFNFCDKICYHHIYVFNSKSIN